MRVECPEGKRPYKTYYSALRRLRYENSILHLRGGEVYRCPRCNNYHITRHFTHKQNKNRNINSKE